MKELSNSKNQNSTDRTVLLGQVLRIESELDDKNIAVKLLKQEETWDSGTFCASKENVVPVHDKFWPFLAAITSPMERVKVAQNKDRCKRLMQIAKEMTVGFSDMDKVYLGTVKHIGVVKGMGKCVGIKLHVSTYFVFLAKVQH